MFNTLFFTGLRKGEALALKFDDILNNQLNINKSLTKEFFNGKRIEITPKTKGSIRKVFIDKKLKKELLNLKKHYYNLYGFFDNNFYVFGGVKPIATTTLERKKNTYCELANVKIIRIHDFRHSHATMLYDKNVNIKIIQARLGHSSISTTLNTYVHIDKEKEKRVLRTLISLH